MKSKIILIFFLGVIFLGFSCRNKNLSNIALKKLLASESKLQGHTGFVLYDPVLKKNLIEHQADRGFVPASNTKLFTFYCALKELGDSLPTIRYVEKGDSLVFWGCGDPSFLSYTISNTTYDFLKQSTRQLFLVNDTSQTPSFWPKGWQWDDYNEYYQPEINHFPIYENTVIFRVFAPDSIEVIPSYFQSFVEYKDGLTTHTDPIVRNYASNHYTVFQRSLASNYRKKIPFKTSTYVVSRLLSDTLKKNIVLITMEKPLECKEWRGSEKSKLLRKMMIESDNLIAEQMGVLLEDKAIAKKYFTNTLNATKLSDYSGMSRMNLVSPRNIISLLDSISLRVGSIDSTATYLPNGGKSGTIKYMYTKIPNKVFAKTGSMQGVYNQSGYIKTHTNRWLLFSYMNNNFFGSISSVKKEVEDYMVWIYTHY